MSLKIFKQDNIISTVSLTIIIKTQYPMFQLGFVNRCGIHVHVVARTLALRTIPIWMVVRSSVIGDYVVWLNIIEMTIAQLISRSKLFCDTPIVPFCLTAAIWTKNPEYTTVSSLDSKWIHIRWCCTTTVFGGYHKSFLVTVLLGCISWVDPIER